MSPIAIGPVTESERSEACRLLFADESRAARCVEMLASRELDANGLFVARAGGVLCGAMLVQPLPGVLGLAWPPRADSVVVEDSLMTAACEWLRGRGVKACQAFAAANERAAFAPLERFGFPHVTQLAQLRREAWPLPPAASSRLTFHPVESSNRDLFARILIDTYTDTLDCPELNAIRDVSDVFAGFERSNAALAFHEDQPVGVLALDAGLEPEAIELAYLGLLPSARGRGFGDELVRYAIGAAGEAVLHLSADVRNEPALRLYARHGFAEYDRRDVFLAVWGEYGKTV